MPAGYIGSNGVDFMGNHFDTKNTTPESLELHYYFDLMRRAGCRAVVLEVSSQALYLQRVCGIPFDAVAFTNLAPDHIGGFEHPTFAHYRDSKKQLFTDYGATFAVGNADDPETAYMLDGCGALCSSFGVGAGDFRAADITPFRAAGELGAEFTLTHFGERCACGCRCRARSACTMRSVPSRLRTCTAFRRRLRRRRLRTPMCAAALRS